MTIRYLVLALGMGLALTAGCRPRNRAPDVTTCTPGTSVLVACGSGCRLGACSGDATLTVCDGTLSIDSCMAGAEGFLGFNDDMCGSLCPGLTVTCPPSGTLLVVPAGYMGRTDFTCAWETQ
jgi:hypothetical protein